MNSNDWMAALQGLKQQMDPDTGPQQPQQAPQPAQPVQTGRLQIVMERKGRAGKTATIVTGFTIGDDAVAALAADLKKALGTGGSARGGEILIQGDRREDVRRFLCARKFKI